MPLDALPLIINFEQLMPALLLIAAYQYLVHVDIIHRIFAFAELSSYESITPLIIIIYPHIIVKSSIRET